MITHVLDAVLIEVLPPAAAQVAGIAGAELGAVPFDLTVAPLLRAALLTVGPAEWVVVTGLPALLSTNVFSVGGYEATLDATARSGGGSSPR